MKHLEWDRGKIKQIEVDVPNSIARRITMLAKQLKKKRGHHGKRRVRDIDYSYI